MFDAAAEGAEVVLGSRFSRESVLINYPTCRRFSSTGRSTWLEACCSIAVCAMSPTISNC